MAARRRWWRRLRVGLTFGFAVGLALVAALSGFLVAHYKLFPYHYLIRSTHKAEAALAALGPREPRVVSTHLLRLTFESVRVPMAGGASSLISSTAEGGGLTSFGDDVLLLAYDGTVYAARSAGTLRATRISAPDNGRGAYAALASDPRYADFEFELKWFRYNDLLHVETPAGRSLFASYTEFHPGRGCYTNTLARLDLPKGVQSIDEVKAGPGDWRVVLRTEPCLPLKRRFVALEGHMAGGRLAFAPPSTLYLTSGDYFHDGVRSELNVAQDGRYQYGKVLAVDLSNGSVQTVSRGHRNPQGIVAAPDGRVFAAEHGPRGGDELNRIRPGVNYGWPLESYGTGTGGQRHGSATSFGRHDRFEAPLMAWTPSIGISGLALVRGFHPAWDGDLVATTLKDRSLHRIRLAAERAVLDERIEVGSRLRAVHQHTDGRLVLWTDDHDLVFVSGAGHDAIGEMVDQYAASATLAAPAAARLKATLERCAECHSFEPGENQRAPSLARVYGRAIGRSEFHDYTAALRQHDGRWDRAALTSFLMHPQEFAPGTAVAAKPVIASDVASVVSFLEFIGRQ
jgi:cytochrome c2